MFLLQKVKANSIPQDQGWNNGMWRVIPTQLSLTEKDMNVIEIINFRASIIIYSSIQVLQSSTSQAVCQRNSVSHKIFPCS